MNNHKCTIIKSVKFDKKHIFLLQKLIILRPSVLALVDKFFFRLLEELNWNKLNVRPEKRYVSKLFGLCSST